MMNRKTAAAFIGVLVLIVIIVALMKKRPSVPAATMPKVPHEIYTETPTESAPHEPDSVVVQEARKAEDTKQLEQASRIEGATLQEKIKNTKLINTDEYREEVRKNPHGTPLKYIESSLKLGTLFDNVKSEKDATEVFAYYKDCLSSDAPAPLKVTCYSYSQRISTNYPSLKKDFDPLYSNLDPEVRKVVDVTHPKK
jgi:hypothetical protein